MFSYTKSVIVLLFLFFLSTSAQAVEQDLESSRDPGGVIWGYAVLPLGPTGEDVTIVYVHDVAPGSFAESIGIKERDILVEMNGKTVHSMPPMEVGFRIVAILRSLPGTIVELVMLRGSEEVFFKFQIG